MPRITPYKKLLLNLEQQFSEEFGKMYIPHEKAYRRLKELTGQDFGYDAEAWRKWLIESGIDPDND